MAPTSWVCTVCGYVHQGPEPPEVCPVCGAAREVFEPRDEPAPAGQAATPKRWHCMVCGYVHEGDAPPEGCPVCAAGSDCFEPEAETAGARPTGGRGGRVLIAGAGIAGVSVAEALRGASDDAEIVLLSREAEAPYHRLNLTRYLAGEVGEPELPLHPEAWYSEREIELRLGVEVSGIEKEKRRVRLSDGGEEPYDTLILTAGSHPFVPPIPGSQREGATGFRTASDARRILEAGLGGAKCVCIGGGLLGIETAGALARRGADVAVIEGAGWLMPRQLSRRGGEILADHVRAAGIRLYSAARVDELLGDERVRGVALKGGATVDADLVISTAGVRSNSYLARLAGLEVNFGVVVDNHLATSDPSILAAGDVAEHHGVLYGIWPAAQYMGTIAGMNAAGLEAEFGGIPRSNTLKVLDVSVVSIGLVEPEDASYLEIESEREGQYLRFLFRDNRLLGAQALGDTAVAAPARKAIEDGTDFSALLQKNPGAEHVAETLLAS